VSNRRFIGVALLACVCLPLPALGQQLTKRVQRILTNLKIPLSGTPTTTPGTFGHVKISEIRWNKGAAVLCDALDGSIILLYRVGMPRIAAPKSALPTAELDAKALQYARYLGGPKREQILLRRWRKTDRFSGGGGKQDLYEVTVGPIVVGYPDELASAPHAAMTIDPQSGELYEASVEWRVSRSPVPAGPFRKPAEALARGKSLVPKSGHVTAMKNAGPTSVDLEYVVPNGVLFQGGRAGSGYKRSFPATSQLAYVVKLGRVTIWLDPKTLRMLGGGF
jgi:hypothetical protein